MVNWIDTPVPLIVPFWFGGGAFYIFLIRQFMLQLPKELDEAAFADGASYFRIYWNIILPLVGPALATVAIFSVVARWNDFIGPLIFLNAETWRTLALALRTFLVGETANLGGMGGAVPRWNLLMVSGEVMMLPIVTLFFVAQRYFIRGIALTGLTGR
jgi:multiple sugar transport system permease protein